MSTATTASSVEIKPGLAGQIVVVIGGTAGIGLETARRARLEGADLVLAARNPEQLERTGRELGALTTVAFDATNFERLGNFFADLRTPIDHVLVTGPGPYYAPLVEFDFEKARRDVEAHLFLPMQVARNAMGKVRPGGTLLFMGGTGGRRTAPGASVDLGAHGCASRSSQEPRARTRAHPREPDRSRVRRHAPFRVVARRPIGQASRAAPHHATHQTRCWCH